MSASLPSPVPTGRHSAASTPPSPHCCASTGRRNRRIPSLGHGSCQFISPNPQPRQRLRRPSRAAGNGLRVWPGSPRAGCCPARIPTAPLRLPPLPGEIEFPTHSNQSFGHGRFKANKDPSTAGLGDKCQQFVVIGDVDCGLCNLLLADPGGNHRVKETLDSVDIFLPLPHFSIQIDTNHNYNDNHNQHPVGSNCQHNSPFLSGNLGTPLRMAVR